MKNTRRFQAVARVVSTYAGTILLSLFSFSIPAVSGQLPVQVGNKVRVTAPRIGLMRSVGVVREVDDGILEIDFGQAEGGRRIRSGEITKMEVTFTRSSHRLAGSFIGMVAGAVVGAAQVGPSRDSDYCAGDPNARGQGWLPTAFCIRVTGKFKRNLKRVAGGLIGGLVGGGIGAFVGSRLKTDRWVPAFAREAQVSVSPPFRLGGASFGISVSF